MRFDPASVDSVPVSWQWAPEDAAVFTASSPFRSRIWLPQGVHPAGLGEVLGQPRVYSKGALICDADGTAVNGEESDFADGITYLPKPLVNPCLACGPPIELTCMTAPAPFRLLLGSAMAADSPDMNDFSGYVYKQTDLPFWIGFWPSTVGPIWVRFGCIVNELNCWFVEGVYPAIEADWGPNYPVLLFEGGSPYSAAFTVPDDWCSLGGAGFFYPMFFETP